MADQNGERWETEEASTRRVRQSEALLVQLYRDSVEPDSRVMAVRGLKIIVFVSFASLVVFLATLFLNYNTFVTLQEDVLTQNSNLDSAIQRRTNLFTNLVRLTLSHAALEHAIYTHAADTRTEIIKKSNLPEAVAESIIAKSGGTLGVKPGANPADALTGKVGGAGGVEFDKVLEALSGGQGVENSIGRLLAVVEQYPNVRSSETYKDLMVALVELESQIVNARQVYNMAARQYNTAISKFPWYMLAQMADFDRAKYFDPATNVGPLIDPVLYEQLVPLVEGKKVNP